MRPDDPQTEVPYSPGFAVRPPDAERPNYDPSDSPLVPGGTKGAPAPAPADASLVGLKKRDLARQPRVTFRVRREGWLARRTAARERFRHIGEARPSATERLMAGLDRRGILERSKQSAVRPRFNLRGLP